MKKQVRRKGKTVTGNKIEINKYIKINKGQLKERNIRWEEKKDK